MTAPVNGAGGVSPLPPTAIPAPVRQPAPAQSPDRTDNSGGTGGVSAPSFADQLRHSSGGVEFSKHALERLQRRGIDTNAATMRRLEHGIELAAGKNARNAVVMVDDKAFVVAVKNRTVITAIDDAHMRQHVFTNIDSAVIA